MRLSRAASNDNALNSDDLGGGAGSLVEELLELGIQAVGFHDLPAAILPCRESGLPVLASKELEARLGSFDVISAIEIIEPAPDPRAFSRYVVSLLTIDGIAYVQMGDWHVVRRLPGTASAGSSACHSALDSVPDLRSRGRGFDDVNGNYAPFPVGRRAV